jgi:ubiquinone/menaquinone biosynthesis C-methylase UbiE
VTAGRTVRLVPDAVFEHPRLVGVYDALDGDRSDLAAYVDLLHEAGARSVLDVGCGTGTFALLLAGRGLQVTAVDPASGSLAVARAKPGAARVAWIRGTAADLPAVQADAATMTANVAQAVVDPQDWEDALRGVHRALRPGGLLLLETRDPRSRAWEHWTRAETHAVQEVEGVGAVETWTEVTDVDGPLVTFRSTWVFHADGAVLTSDSTLRFREQHEVVASLVAHGFAVDDVRTTPDRFGRELLLVARRA